MNSHKYENVKLIIIKVLAIKVGLDIDSSFYNKNTYFMNLSFRKALESDISAIITLLFEDSLGQSREKKDQDSYLRYLEAFTEIDKDPNHYLMVVELKGEIVASCHLTLLPSLTYCGSKRMLIEAVRVHKDYRNQKIGESMLNEAIKYAKSKHVSIIQLTTNIDRFKAIEFYKQNGLEQTHVGFKMHIEKK